jgi:hypothetical protein
MPEKTLTYDPSAGEVPLILGKLDAEWLADRLTVLGAASVPGHDSPRAQRIRAKLRDALPRPLDVVRQECGLCNRPRATGTCPHLIQTDDQVTMSRVAWDRQVEELTRLRSFHAKVADLVAEAQ